MCDVFVLHLHHIFEESPKAWGQPEPASLPRGAAPDKLLTPDEAYDEALRDWGTRR